MVNEVKDSRIGERANPHPSGAQTYEVVVVDEDDHGVTVEYVEDPSHIGPWWVNSAAWEAWKK